MTRPRPAATSIPWILPFIVVLTSPSSVVAQGSAAAPDAQPPIALFPTTEASGTSWVPDETPMAGRHWRIGTWEVMVHGVVFAQLALEPGEVHRTGGFSSHQVSSVNWGMLMARRPLGAGRVGLRTMMSGERWTVGDCGFIDFFASGEMCDGDTIHDRQHPHDLFMELAADYSRPLSSSIRWQVYGGLAGEPALGPPAFPHRLSAALNPVGPIGHHWLDSTHVAFGVVTTGIETPRIKVEGSIFNGREPDERRTDLDLGVLDSYSGRVTFLPNPRLALQVSAGHLEQAEAQFAPDPPTDVERVTTSATTTRPVFASGMWATTIAYGLSSEWILLPGTGVRRWSQALLFETSVSDGRRNTWFGRFEVVGKPGHDLHADAVATAILPTSKLQGGFERELTRRHGMTAGVGGTIAVSLVPRELIARYYGRWAPGFGVFLVLRPAHRM